MSDFGPLGFGVLSFLYLPQAVIEHTFVDPRSCLPNDSVCGEIFSFGVAHVHVA